MCRLVSLASIAIAVLGLPIAALAAQEPRVVVSGVVKDTSGAVLPGAMVEGLVAGLSVVTTTTTADGRYRLELAAQTRHQLRASSNGFATETVDLKTAADAATHDFVLKLAALSDTVVVTAERVAETRSTASESIAVFTRRDIEALGSPALADIIRMVPGLSVESNGREGALASLFARGGESDYNLVLIDGVEIVRGAQSALYGSDAIGSVVQIFTRRASPGDPPRIVGSVEGGTFDTWRADAHLLGGAHRRVDYQLGGAHRGTEGAFQDLLTEHDTFKESSIDGTIGAVLGDAVSLRTGGRYASAKGKAVGPIDYGSRDTGTVADTTDLSWHVDFAHRLSERVNQAATFTYYKSYRLSADTIADPTYRVYALLEGTPGALFPQSPRLVRLLDQPAFAALQSGRDILGAGQILATTAFGVSDFVSSTETEFRRPAFKYQADYNWAAGQLLTGGYEYERETDPLHVDFLVENNAFFAQQRFSAGDRVSAGVGARVDHNSRYGTTGSPKVSIGGLLRPYQPGLLSSLKVFANVGRGIKNPQFGELYSSAFSDGNPALKPERARTMDAGVEATLDNQRLMARVAYFNNKYRDQVAFKSTGPGLDGKPDFINIDESEARGWEVDAVLQRPVAGGLIASAGYGFVDTNVVAFVSPSDTVKPGQPLIRRPKHSATMRLAYSRGRASASFNLRYVGERHDAAFLGLSIVQSDQFPIGRSIDITVNPAYTVMGLGGEYRVGQAASAFVRVDNFSNTTYESALGYPGLPRAFVVGMRIDVRARP
jgi:vitamin B12 transporter